MKIFNREVKDEYRALTRLIDIYTGTEPWYRSACNIKSDYLVGLRTASKRDHGIELDLISGGKKMTINITIII
jgi:hypothetical protein